MREYIKAWWLVTKVNIFILGVFAYLGLLFGWVYKTLNQNTDLSVWDELDRLLEEQDDDQPIEF